MKTAPFTFWKKYLRLWTCLLFIVVLGGSAFGQETAARITISHLPAAHVSVEGTEATARKSWSFPNSYGSVEKLNERVNNFKAFDDHGAQVEVAQIGTGEYASPVACRKFRYEVALTPPSSEASIAHVSWLGGERGVLMLNDLLPRSVTGRITLQLALPAGWHKVSTELERNQSFVVENVADAVFVVGRRLRERSARIGRVEFSFVTDGSWAFTDDEAFATITELYREHRKIVGDVPRKRVLVTVQSFPQDAPSGNWRSEVRGATVNFFTGKQLSRAAALTNLSTAIAHELLHLWVPNGLALDGAYDWFYEGFVEYQALRTSMRIGIVNYQTYLDAIARTYDRYLAAHDSGGMSLLAASQKRWALIDHAVYSKGLLVAFIYDLMLRRVSSNNKTLDDVFRELMKRHSREKSRQDGNTALVELLNETLGANDFTKMYVEQAGTIDFKQSFAEFGLQTEWFGARTRIYVSKDLSRWQATLHHKLGRSY